MNFVMIGVPIIGVAIIAASGWYCLCCRRASGKETEKLAASTVQDNKSDR